VHRWRQELDPDAQRVTARQPGELVLGVLPDPGGVPGLEIRGRVGAHLVRCVLAGRLWLDPGDGRLRGAADQQASSERQLESQGTTMGDKGASARHRLPRAASRRP